jgi:hypothetical protein
MTWGRVREYLADWKCLVGVAVGLSGGLFIALVIPWAAGKFCTLNKETVAATVLGVAAGGLISVGASYFFGYVFYYRSGRELDMRSKELVSLSNVILSILSCLAPNDQIRIGWGPDGKLRVDYMGRAEARGGGFATATGYVTTEPPQPPPVYDRQHEQPDLDDASP